MGDTEYCNFCGILTENPCGSLPPDICSQAVESTTNKPPVPSQPIRSEIAMKRLEELAGELLEQVNGGSEQRVLEEAAAILLAASKVDVAGLMELAAIAAYHGSNEESSNAMYEAAEANLETALRMALAVREWQPIETAPKDGL